MNSAEKEQWEALYAGLAMLGYIICEADADVIPDASRKMAKKMMENPLVGLPAIKRRK